MTTRDDTNPYDDQKTAVDWISAIEGEKGRVRDSDLYPRIKSWIDRVSAREILDIGCGQGICSEKIDLDGRCYTGLDSSSLLIERAKERYHRENRRFMLGSAYALPFSDGEFDAVFSVLVWHLLSDLPRATFELARILKAK